MGFRDTFHYDRYIKGSVFLPHLNNEEDDDATKAARKEKFTALNGLQLMMFTEDTMVYPKESEWFQQLDPMATSNHSKTQTSTRTITWASNSSMRPKKSSLCQLSATTSSSRSQTSTTPSFPSCSHE